MLNDKIAIVTGAGAGIGHAIATLFAHQRATVFALDRDAASAEAAAAEIRASGGKAHGCAADVRDPHAVEAAVQQAIAQYSRVDILVNNAGIFPRRAFLEMTESDWDLMHDINLKGVFHVTKAVAPHMVHQRSGKIVNISSVTFHIGTPNLSHYVASKGGVIGLTRSLAREFGDYGVHINCITPGAIQTESEKNFVSEQDIRHFLDSQCLKRRLGPLDIARVALFLSSELSDGMTGQTLNVDAGWVMY